MGREPKAVILRARQPANYAELGRLEQLAVDHSPLFVAYPEEKDGGPPYSGGRADYHPRPVEQFLCRAKAFPTWPLKVALEYRLVFFLMAAGFATWFGLSFTHVAPWVSDQARFWILAGAGITVGVGFSGRLANEEWARRRAPRSTPPSWLSPNGRWAPLAKFGMWVMGGMSFTAASSPAVAWRLHFAPIDKAKSTLKSADKDLGRALHEANRAASTDQQAAAGAGPAGAEAGLASPTKSMLKRAAANVSELFHETSATDVGEARKRRRAAAAEVRRQERRASYVHIDNTGPGLVVQYWQFYSYNDFTNRHEGDWEVVMVFFNNRLEPEAAAYSVHGGGLWRPWSRHKRGTDVQVVDGRPVVYVARGSHAQYFDHRPEGHETSWTQLVPNSPFWSRARVTLGRHDGDGRHRDHEPCYDDATEEIPYDLEFMPEMSTVTRYRPEVWEKWWWLQFPGRWGAARFGLGKSGISGPAFQGPRWSSPWDWVGRHCVEDRQDSWDELREGLLRDRYDLVGSRAEPPANRVVKAVQRRPRPRRKARIETRDAA